MYREVLIETVIETAGARNSDTFVDRASGPFHGFN
jgi:hypothetical protein